MKNRVQLIMLSLFWLLPAALVLVCTSRNGLGVSPDSVSYIEVARSLGSMHGVLGIHGDVMIHWPPFYPAFLAMGSFLLAQDVMEAGRWVSVLLIALFFIIFNLILQKKKSSLVQVMSMNLLLLFSQLLWVFGMLWSESLFLVLELSSIYFLLRWMENDDLSFLRISGLLAGSMFMTRYAGAGFIAGSILFILFQQKTGWGNSLRRILHYSLSAALIGLPWILFMILSAYGPENRGLAFHMIGIDQLNEMIRTFYHWFLPNSFKLSPYITGIIFFILLMLIVLALIREKKGNRQKMKTKYDSDGFIVLMIWLIATYLLFILITLIFIDASVKLNNRMLSPLYPLVLFIFADVLRYHVNNRSTGLALAGFLLLIMASTLVNSAGHWSRLGKSGSGYTSQSWRESEVVNVIGKIGTGAVYSNGEDVIRLYYPEKFFSIKSIPCRINRFTLVRNRNLPEELLVMKERIESGKAALVYFDKIPWRDYLVELPVLMDSLKNVDVMPLKDGKLFYAHIPGASGIKEGP